MAGKRGPPGQTGGKRGRVEKWRGGLGWAYRLPALSVAGASLAQPCSVSTSRSSNRTCGFPASGSPTGFTAGMRRAFDTSVLSVSVPPWLHDTACSESFRNYAVLYRLAPSHPPSPSSISTPEVRVLSSTGVTQLHRYYDPVRLPLEPMPYGTVEAATLAQHGPPPLARSPVSTCRAHYPGGPVQVRLSAASPDRAAFPELRAGRRPQVPFRGLLRLHSHYRPSSRSPARGGPRPPQGQAFVAGLRSSRLLN